MGNNVWFRGGRGAAGQEEGVNWSPARVGLGLGRCTKKVNYCLALRAAGQSPGPLRQRVWRAHLAVWRQDLRAAARWGALHLQHSLGSNAAPRRLRCQARAGRVADRMLLGWHPGPTLLGAVSRWAGGMTHPAGDHNAAAAGQCRPGRLAQQTTALPAVLPLQAAPSWLWLGTLHRQGTPCS